MFCDFLGKPSRILLLIGVINIHYGIENGQLNIPQQILIDPKIATLELAEVTHRNNSPPPPPPPTLLSRIKRS
ncbi:hypothetical protein Leryth_026336 [Lithospermum erythrorhizon]|nr:hypothetical protein Leryth_026336 [Lithospermum erythrorhizon]